MHLDEVILWKITGQLDLASYNFLKRLQILWRHPVHRPIKAHYVTGDLAALGACKDLSTGSQDRGAAVGIQKIWGVPHTLRGGRAAQLGRCLPDPRDQPLRHVWSLLFRMITAVEVPCMHTMPQLRLMQEMRLGDGGINWGFYRVLLLLGVKYSVLRMSAFKCALPASCLSS